MEGDVMAVKPSVQEFLRTANVPYSVFPHVRAYTAQQEAAVTHTPGRDWAKAVVCFADGAPIQAVVPADRRVNLERLRQAARAQTIRLAAEEELEWLFPDCEPGAMPPLGAMYNQRVFVDELLTREAQIVFNGGTHQDAVCMAYEDYARLAHPMVGRFSERFC
jgi:Ala-tRNA(Pro) deacylase